MITNIKYIAIFIISLCIYYVDSFIRIFNDYILFYVNHYIFHLLEISLRIPELNMFLNGNETSFTFALLSCLTIEYFINKAENETVYLRPIAGIEAMEEAVGRATEMGKSVLYVPGISGLDQVDTLSGLIILGHTAEMTAKYEANLHVPVASPIVMETAKESCKESYLRSGRPDLYKEDMVHYVTDDQFA